MIYGLPEISEQEDNRVVGEIVKQAGHDPRQAIHRWFRMGDGKTPDGKKSKFPRLVKVQLNSDLAKSDIMRGQKNIIKNIPELQGADYSQYFRHDLTQRQRLLHAEKVRERNEFKQEFNRRRARICSVQL